MSEARPSGWYDDPNDPSLLHYWDGVMWSGRTMPKIKPNLDQSSIGSPPPAPEPQQQQGYPGQVPPAGYGPPRAPYDPSAYARPTVRTTPDGAPLSGWWRRALGYVIDNILTTIVALAATWSTFNTWLTQYQAYFDDMLDKASSGGQTTLQQPSVPWQTFALLLAVSAVYEISMVAWRGQTLGHMAAGIRVRRTDSDVPPSLAGSATRWVVKQAGNLVGFLPVISFAGSLFTLINYLFPLWDKQSQALHDKAARTFIVRGAPATAERQAKTW